MWNSGFAPGHSRRAGELHLGGVPASVLAERYGTPLVVLDDGVFDAAVADFMAAAVPLGIEVAYAAKALFFIALGRRLALTPLALDVCSMGELLTAERAGFPASRITLHGCGKTGEELDAAARHRVGTIVVDNLDELHDLARRAHADTPVDVVLRMNTGIEAHTHEFVRTGGDRTKFGMPFDALAAAEAVFKQAPALHFSGLHSHIGSQIFDEHAFIENTRLLIAAAARAASFGLVTERVIAGGGFGIATSPKDAPSLQIQPLLHTLARTVKACAAAENLPAPRLGIEPGRALIGAAGTSLYRVVATKEQFGTPYVVVDGGLADNPRPALYDAYHHPILASREETLLRETTLCGRSCENDRIVVAPFAHDVQRGDLVAICTTGAYTYSMASNYNRFGRPAIVFVRDGFHTPVVHREQSDDVLRNDCNELALGELSCSPD